MLKINNKRNSSDELVNENIHFKQVLVIGPNGESLGILMRREAIEKAYEYGLDLFCVAPQGNPPVCKILDYGRYRFEQQKKAKEAKRNQHVTEIKQIRVSPVIDTHDFETKCKQARTWLEDGQKVKIDMKFRGRMMTRQDVGRKVMQDFVTSLNDIAITEKVPNLEGNIMSCVIAPRKKA